MTQIFERLVDTTKIERFNPNTDIVITPNKRLASALMKSWSFTKSKANVAWEELNVKALEDWLNEIFELVQLSYENLTDKNLVSKQQELFLWKKIIKTSKINCHATNAKIFSDTLSELYAHNANISDIPYYRESTRIFAKLSKRYFHELESNNLLSTKSRDDSILDFFKEDRFHTKYENIICFGFDNISVLHLDIFKNASENFFQLNPGCKNAETLVAPCDNDKHELYAATQWAADALATESHKRVAIIVPNLASNLDQVYRFINDALADNSLKLPVNISAGKKLSNTSIGFSLINLLHSFHEDHTYQHWISLLYDPFTIFSKVPNETLHRIENMIRNNNEYFFNISKFINLVCNETNWDCSNTDKVLIEKILGISKFTFPKKTNFKTWAELFKEIVLSFGWEHSTLISELEQQQIEGVLSTLLAYERMDSLKIEVHFQDALDTLRNHFTNVIFHPKTTQSPLEILGYLEGRNLEFDAIWICSLSSDQYPLRIINHPVLPLDFRKKFSMRRSDPHREIEFFQTEITSYQKNCSTLILSYPKKIDGAELSPCPILAKLLKYEDKIAKIKAFDYPKSIRKKSLVRSIKEKCPKFDNAIENGKISIQTIEDQASCPFNAFAIHRLYALPQNEPALGLAPQQRGSLIHDILLEFWSDIKTSKNLANLNDFDLTHHLEASIDKSLANNAGHLKCLRGSTFKRLEASRLKTLIFPLLKLEKERKPFNILSLEHQEEFNFQDISLRCRIDRIDEAEGKFFIIDYKTGISSKNEWQKNPIRSFQLPIYCLGLKKNIVGFCNAQIRANEHKYIGLTTDENFPGNSIPKETWQKLKISWENQINNLIERFLAGDVSLPSDSKYLSKYQEYLIPLSRYYEENI